MEYSVDRGQGLLEIFWNNRRELEEAKDAAHGNNQRILENFSNLLNRKGRENDMENW